MHIVFLGAGAIGGYFGGRLIEHKAADVTFLVRPRRKSQLDADGLRIESPMGNAAVKAKALLAGEIRAPADYVVLTCKAFDLDSAIETIMPAVGPETAVVPLLNGLSHIDTLNKVFGAKRVLGGLAKIGVTMLPDGQIKHLNDLQVITFGEQDGTISPRVAALKASFDKAKVTATAAPDIRQQMWEKLVFLSTLACMTTLMRANVGEIARTPDGVDIGVELLERNARIAAAEGHPMPATVMEYTTKFMQDTASPLTASMLRDLESGGQVEADHVVGYLLDTARRHAIDDLLHRICYTHLKAYEQRRAANRL